MAISIAKTRSKATDLKADLQTIRATLAHLPKENLARYKNWNSLDTALDYTIRRIDDLVKELNFVEGSDLFYRGH